MLTKVSRGLMVLALAISTLAGCGERVPTFRYKLIAMVETPEGIRQESTVVELKNFYQSGVLGTGLESRAKGEAIPVDLGKRGTLFILLTSQDDPSIVFGMPFAALLPVQPDDRGTSEALANNYRTWAKVTGIATLPRDAYPQFVRFRDIRDPTDAWKTCCHGLEIIMTRCLTVVISNTPTATFQIN